MRFVTFWASISKSNINQGYAYNKVIHFQLKFINIQGNEAQRK